VYKISLATLHQVACGTGLKKQLWQQGRIAPFLLYLQQLIT
jgi:hypothetical protein